MTGSLFPARIVFLLIAIVIGFNFMTGHLNWNKDRLACTEGYKWSNGDWHVIYAIGKLEYRLHDFACPKSQQYDPKQYKPYTGQDGHTTDTSPNAPTQ